jgi:hypothetical protein
MKTYRKRFGLFRDPAIRDEIRSLDPVADCQRIVHLLACYEFPADIQRALELGLFHTYGSVNISHLLARTGEFTNAGQKRYDDTRLLISHLLESGFENDPGARELARMNEIHGKFKIADKDFIFVLSIFIEFPLAWLRDFGWRAFTPSEQEAWFAFFYEVGIRMGLRDIPSDRAALARFVSQYESTHMVYAPSNREIADATIAVMRAWLPRLLRPVVRPVISCLVSEKLLTAFDYPRPSAFLRVVVRVVLALRAAAKRYLNFERSPALIVGTANRSYHGNSYVIEDLGPRRVP